MKILDLGCGPHKTPGSFGVDAYSFAGVDLVHDLNRRPWPLADNAYERIVARHIIEHVEDVPAFMAEIHRVAAPRARVEIRTPHFSTRSAYADPTHKRAMSVRAFDFFTGSEPRRLTAPAIAAHWLLEHRFVFERFAHVPPFSLLERRLTFSRFFRFIRVQWFANRFLDFYEFYCAWLYPARDIEIALRVEKD